MAELDTGICAFLLDSLQLTTVHLQQKSISIPTADRILNRDINELRKSMGISAHLSAPETPPDVRVVDLQNMSIGEAKERQRIADACDKMAEGVPDA
jgi:hypothetical protein